MNGRYPKPPIMNPEMQNAMREQQIINARLAALSAAAQIFQGTGAEMQTVIEQSEKAVTYIIGDVEALKPKSGIVITGAMPPQGMFKPGE